MPIRVKNRSRYNEHFRSFRSMKVDPGPNTPPQKEQIDEVALADFDAEYEAFVAEQKRLKAEREAAQPKKKRKKKNETTESNI